MKALLLTFMALVPLTAQEDPAAAGPRTVASKDYKVEQVPLPTVAYPVDVWGTVWYPEDLSGGPLPLVLLLHGNHGICRLPGTQTDLGTTLFPPLCPPGQIQAPNHSGYEYIATRLASRGYIVASINVNAINTRANGNPERGQVVLEHLHYWQVWNSPRGGAPFGTQFSGKVDLKNVGLMGHSRGGEGVRAALEFNRQSGNPYEIKGVIEIGPVDFGRTTSATAVTTGNPVYNAADTAFSVILPSCDADVFDNQGMRVYDRGARISERTKPAAKSQLYVLGANHNFYNSEWTPEDTGFSCIDFPIITERSQQEAIGLVYVTGFMRTYLGGEDFRYLFSGDQPQPASILTPVAHSYMETLDANLLIDNFTGPFTPFDNNLGGPNVAGNVKVTRCIGAECNNPPPAAWRHDPAVAVARIDWPDQRTGTPYYAIHVGERGAARDVSGYGMLSFRVAAAFDMRNPLVGSQDFSIRLMDAAGNSSPLLPVTKYKTITFPTGYNVRRSVLRSIRIPLADFSGVDLRRLVRVDLIFDQRPQGSIFLGEVMFAPMGGAR
jgi:hypothetical protein